MVELLHEAIAPVNVLYTGLLVLILIYWLSVIVGALDLSAFDFDLDLDLDADIDADVDVAVSGSWLAGALQFFNFGKLPFMIILSLLTMCMWSFSVLGNHYLGDGSILFALALFFPMLFVSLFITKGLTTPLVPLFKDINGVEDVDFIGMTCRVTLATSSQTMGQAEVLANDSYLLINVRCDEALKGSLEKGQEAIILAKAADKDFYIIDAI